MAVGVLAELVLERDPGVPPEPRTLPAAPWRRGYHLAGDPQLAGTPREPLADAGRRPGRPRAGGGAARRRPRRHAGRRVDLARPAGVTPTWRWWLRHWARRDQLPPRLDLTAVAARWADRVGRGRVHLVVGTAAARRPARRSASPRRPTGCPPAPPRWSAMPTPCSAVLAAPSSTSASSTPCCCRPWPPSAARAPAVPARHREWVRPPGRPPRRGADRGWLPCARRSGRAGAPPRRTGPRPGRTPPRSPRPSRWPCAHCSARGRWGGEPEAGPAARGHPEDRVRRTSRTSCSATATSCTAGDPLSRRPLRRPLPGRPRPDAAAVGRAGERGRRGLGPARRRGPRLRRHRDHQPRDPGHRLAHAGPPRAGVARPPPAPRSTWCSPPATWSGRSPRSGRRTSSTGGRSAYARFLEHLRDPDRQGRLATWFWGVQEIPDILDRWGETSPRERVHLVTVPPQGAPPTLLWERFAETFGIDPTRSTPTSNAPTPRSAYPRPRCCAGSTSASTTSLHQPHYRALVRELLVHRKLSRRTGSPRLSLPPDVAPWASDLGRSPGSPSSRYARVRRGRRPRRPVRRAAVARSSTPTTRDEQQVAEAALDALRR